MKTGDTFCDPQGRSYQAGLLLGRGLWGKTYRVSREDDAGDYVLKCPLSAAEYAPTTGDIPKLEQSFREILDEQAELLTRTSYDFLPTLVDHFLTDEDVPVMVLERLPGSFQQRMAAGATFLESLDLLIQTARLCQLLRDGPGFHGALKPGNILVDENGAVKLSDVATPTARRLLPLLRQASASNPCFLPPEIVQATREPPFSVVADTYAIGRLVWCSVRGVEGGPRFPEQGPDKASLVALKDRLHARVKQEDSNPRFHGRLADRLSATISRAVSARPSPSPPYRFDRLDELLPRLVELRSLVRPEVDTVGRVLLDRAANVTHFTTEEKIRFSISVGCSAGVERHEEIACGLAVFDRDGGQRVREVPSTYDVARHPSGRFRFQFEISDLRPGNYRVRAAFAIRDSGHEPSAQEVELEVRAAHGYIPPPEQPPPGPLTMQPHVEEPRTVTQPMQAPFTPPPGAPPFSQPAQPGQPPPPAPSPPTAGSFPRTAPPPLAVSRPAPVSKPASRPSPTPPLTSHGKPAISVQRTDERPAPRTRGLRGDTVPASSGDTAIPVEEPPSTGLGTAPRVPRPTPTASVTGQDRLDAIHRQALVPANEPPGPEPTIPSDSPSTATRAEQEMPAPPAAAASGSWADLPMEDELGDDITELADDYDDLDEFRPKSAWRQLLDMVMGDTYAMFMAGASIFAIILLIILFLLKS